MTQDLSSQYTQKTEKEKKQRKNGSNFWGALIQMKNYKSVTEYPPNLQWAICNLHSDSRRTFHLARLDLLGVNKRNLVSGLPHLHPIFTPEPPINAFICRLFLCSSKTQLVLHPSKSSCTSSSVRCISFDQKTMPVQMSISLSFNFHPYVAETPLQNRDALSFLASASILLSSLGLLGERSRCPTAKAYSHQSYRFSPDTGPSNAAMLSRTWHPGKWLSRSLIGSAFWNASLACLNVSSARPIAGSHLLGYQIALGLLLHTHTLNHIDVVFTLSAESNEAGNCLRAEQRLISTNS